MEREEIKWIKDYEGLYQITSWGRVISIDRYDRYNRKVGGELKQFLQGRKKYRYWCVRLSKNGIGKIFKVHQLVARAFIPNPDNKKCIDHIDTDKNNNHADNLRWVTYKENMNNPITVKRMSDIAKKNGTRIGSDNLFSRRIAVYKVTGEHIGDYDSAGLAIKDLSLPPTTNVGRVCRGERKHTHGYVFRYLTTPERFIDHTNCKKKGCKAVVQTDVDGFFVNEYESIAEAGRVNNYNPCSISKALSGLLKTYKGYKWRYK